MSLLQSLSNSKKWIILSVATLAAASLVFFYFFSTKNEKKQAPDPAFSEFINAYTSGHISSESTVRIVLTNPSKDSVSPGQEADGLFDFSPSISGKTYWVDAYTIEFKPSFKLPSGQSYHASFKVAKVANVEEDKFKRFEFDFTVIPQSFEIEPLGLRCEGTDSYTYQGRLLLADVASLEEVNVMLSTKGDPASAEISWTAGTDRMNYSFTISKIVRQESSYDLDLILDGKSIGISSKIETSVTIPAKSDFSLLDAQVLYRPDQHISLVFSNPIQPNQNLEGLISLKGAGDLKFSIQNNEIKAFLSTRQSGLLTLIISPGLKDVSGNTIKEEIRKELQFEQLKPSVRALDEGVIVPTSNGIIFPFEAVNVRSVIVKIVKIYETNIPQFFQVNDLKSNRELVRVGRPLLVKTVSLTSAGVLNLAKWNRYQLDLSDYIIPEPGALYQVTISFKKKHAVYDCAVPLDKSDQLNDVTDEEELARFDEQYNKEDSYWDYYDDYYEDYDWQERDNPCHSSYYSVERNTTLQKNILASDLGIIAKTSSSGDMKVVVTDIRTAEPLSGVEIEWLDYQQQLISKGTTDNNGEVSANANNRKVFLVIAKQGKQRGYLKVDNASSLSTSNFDVSGTITEKGLKGFLYGERGVWRPGDSIFVSFMLEDKAASLPSSHPIIIELFNPSGQLVERKVTSKKAHGLHLFASKTDPTAPTGQWSLKVKVGGASFTKNLKIEDVKPNRLKVSLDFGKDRIVSGDASMKGKLNARWLHGATASHLKAKYTVYLSQGKTTFDRYPNFSFDDPGKSFETIEMDVFDGQLDESGNAQVNFSVDQEIDAPGALNAFFKGKVFEPGGDFSIDNFTIPYYPYTSFAGVSIPKGDKARGMLLTDVDHPVQLVTVDGNGKPVPYESVTVELYKLDWRWWWEQNGNSYSNWVSSSSSTKIASSSLTSDAAGKANWKFTVKYPDWGRFYIRVLNNTSGHSAGKVVYLDWPGWAGKGERVMPGGASMLSIYADQEKYTTNEKVTVKFPGGKGAKAYVSIENGSSILSTEWVNAEDELTSYTFNATPEMAPNIYVHVSLLQPHKDKNNDQPLRMYGLVPILIENPASRLTPIMEMADELRPDQLVSIKVTEKNNKPMAYTIAMVDEGLLDLTRFKTPDPHASFYAREALGVRTWDMYDDVIGSYGQEMDRLLSLGGDGIIGKPKNQDNNLRFKPVVKFLGPFELNGGSATHSFKMPNYVGSVRVMLIAGKDAAYGNTDKTVAVKQPLMVMATLPRVLGPGESFSLPVNLFVSGAKPIDNAQLSLTVSGPVELIGSAVQQVSFGGKKDKLTTYKLKTTTILGQVKILVKAVSGAFNSSQELVINVRNANPEIVTTTDFSLVDKSTKDLVIEPLGMMGTNKAFVEVSSIPPMNLTGRMHFLLAYPYGCIEQTTSAAFPQLFLNSVVELDQASKLKAEENCKAAIDKLQKFQLPDGSFSYWPGNTNTDDWATSYVGHFLVEAKNKGYYIPETMFSAWKSYQKSQANSWKNSFPNATFHSAYRLYTLALAGSAELPAMNRLKESGQLDQEAAWRLAAAYALAGQETIAKKLLEVDYPEVKSTYTSSYGSSLRDMSMRLETLVLVGDRVNAFELVKEITTSLNKPSYWINTHATAYSLLAVAKFLGNEKSPKGLDFSITQGGESKSIKTGLSIARIALDNPSKKQTIKITSNQQGSLFVSVIRSGIPIAGDEQAEEKNLSITVVYKTSKGEVLLPESIEQGTDFIAEVSIVNKGNTGEVKNIALSQVFPSGWEIQNMRLDNTQHLVNESTYDYRDIRDDRVNTFFSLPASGSKRFKVLLTATYAGRYYLPAVNCAAMYDNTSYARTKGTWVEVIKKATMP